jgi:glycosyltransferase involved in cell wall biosynthesis
MDGTGRTNPARVAAAVTACIPTLRRPGHLRRTLKALLEGDLAPAAILVSDGSQRRDERAEVERVCAGFDPQGAVVELIPPPPCANPSGNRNWLAAYVQTPYLLFVDDDVDVHPRFLADACGRMSDGASIVVAASPEMGGSGWFTRRGHFRRARTSDPIAVGLQCSVWRTELFTSLWLDESIEYGYEDADLSLRMYTRHSPLVYQSEYPFEDRGADDASDKAAERRLLADRSRGYVAVRRHGSSRRSLALFLAHEMFANAARRRRLLPPVVVPRQWRDAFLFLFGGRPPRWAMSVPSPAHRRGEGQWRVFPTPVVDADLR